MRQGDGTPEGSLKEVERSDVIKINTENCLDLKKFICNFVKGCLC